MSRTQNILVVGSTQGVFGGIEVFMLALGEYLNALPNVSCKVVFKLVKGYELQPSLTELIEQTGLEATVLERGNLRLFKYLLWADLIHMQNFPPDVLYPSMLIGKPVVSTQHNWKRSELNLHQILWNIAHKVTSFITYNSGFVARTWENGKTATHRSAVIPTVSRFPKLQPDFSGPRKGFCFISRWIEQKGADLLIDAYAHTCFDRKRHPLRMMGSGPLLVRIKEQVENHPIEGLELMGRVDENTKYEVIASSKWIVAPPECYEDMGLTPIEGRMLGVPAIASRIGGIPESAGSAALYFEAGNRKALTRSLEKAANMPDQEYYRRSVESHESLKTYLRSMEIYPKIYQKLRDPFTLL